MTGCRRAACGEQPSLPGNMFGGIARVAALNYGQVVREIE